MAEAAVEERPPQKFYCHMCNVQFENASANFTCPHCSDGFIEELQENVEHNNEALDVDEWEDDEMEIREILMGSLPVLAERRAGRNRLPESNRSGRRYAVNTRARIFRPRTLPRTNLRQNVPFENLIQDFIINLGMVGPPTNMHQLLLGNPGDYAWGREGLDAIVTQLLNQMDSTGPPPLTKDVIDALPIVEVLVEQVHAKLQCSVCWEDFIVCEAVRQLPCLHIYHEPCIRPWLELHGTCPICRQNLGSNEQNNGENSNPDSVGASTAGVTTLNALRSLFQPSQNPNTASSSSSSLDNNDSSSTRSRSTSNPDSMM